MKGNHGENVLATRVQFGESRAERLGAAVNLLLLTVCLFPVLSRRPDASERHAVYGVLPGLQTDRHDGQLLREGHDRGLQHLDREVDAGERHASLSVSSLVLLCFVLFEAAAAYRRSEHVPEKSLPGSF